MSTGAAFVGLHPKQAFAVALSAIAAVEAMVAAGWSASFGSALLYMNGDERVRYIAVAETLRSVAVGSKRPIYLIPGWEQRSDAGVIRQMILEDRVVPRELP